MQTIKKLAQQEIAKIAAGEVVERPANVIKELLENSIDAGATQVSLTLEKAGKKSISIQDNGIGMSAEDARICFKQHTTSKITSVHDLDSIASYGFRGEALASISAVSKVTITTRQKQDNEATFLELDQGEIIREHICSASPGTTITVQDILYTVPARQKFLKKDETELRSASLVFQAFALLYPHVHFKLTHSGKMLFNCPNTEQHLQRVQQIWPSYIAEHALSVEQTSHATIRVHGVITDGQTSRYDRSLIYTFVNNRLVKNKELTQAVMRGYQGILPAKKFPAAVLFITLPSHEVDVNIHPKKEEVLLLHPRKVQTTIEKAITQTLHKQSSIQEDQTNHSFFKTNPVAATPSTIQPPRPPQHFTVQPFSNKQVTQETLDQKEQTYEEKTQSSYKLTAQPTPTPTKQNTPPLQGEKEQQTSSQESHIAVLGQWADTYIIVSKEDTLILIDQHAAHERIIFEQLKKNVSNVASVQLLFPEFITLDMQDIEILIPHLATLKQHGIILEPFSETELLIQATPAALQSKKITELIHEVLKTIHTHENIVPEELQKLLHEQLHTSISCKTAIKAGQKLTMETMQNLVKQLPQTKNYTTCPHGRPTHYAITQADITKKFKRDYKDKKIDPEHIIL